MIAMMYNVHTYWNIFAFLRLLSVLFTNLSSSLYLLSLFTWRSWPHSILGNATLWRAWVIKVVVITELHTHNFCSYCSLEDTFQILICLQNSTLLVKKTSLLFFEGFPGHLWFPENFVCSHYWAILGTKFLYSWKHVFSHN